MFVVRAATALEAVGTLAMQFAYAYWLHAGCHPCCAGTLDCRLALAMEGKRPGSGTGIYARFYCHESIRQRIVGG